MFTILYCLQGQIIKAQRNQQVHNVTKFFTIMVTHAKSKAEVFVHILLSPSIFKAPYINPQIFNKYLLWNLPSKTSENIIHFQQIVLVYLAFFVLKTSNNPFLLIYSPRPITSHHIPPPGKQAIPLKPYCRAYALKWLLVHGVCLFWAINQQILTLKEEMKFYFTSSNWLPENHQRFIKNWDQITISWVNMLNFGWSFVQSSIYGCITSMMSPVRLPWQLTKKINVATKNTNVVLSLTLFEPLETPMEWPVLAS